MKIRGIHSPSYGGYEGGRKNHIKNQGFTIIRMPGNPLKKDVIFNSTESMRWTGHPAVYPESIIVELIKLLAPKDAIVVDPYVGSGTTCAAAKNTGRRFIGIDIDPGFCRTARKRVGC